MYLLKEVNRIVVDEWQNAARVIVQRGRDITSYDLVDKTVTWPSAANQSAGCPVGKSSPACLVVSGATRFLVAYFDTEASPLGAAAQTAGSAITVKESQSLVEVGVAEFKLVGALKTEESGVECNSQPERVCAPRRLDGRVGPSRSYGPLG